MKLENSKEALHKAQRVSTRRRMIKGRHLRVKWVKKREKQRKA